MSSLDRIESADWRHRPALFGPLQPYDDGRPIVVSELQAALPSRLRELWLDLPPHPNILDAIEVAGEHGLLVRYAALDWGRLPMRLLDRPLVMRTVAGWGVQLADAYEHVLHHVSEDEAGWFTRPLVNVDIGGHVRLGFLPPDAATARCEQDRLVPLVGTQIAALSSPVAGAPPSPITDLVEHCREVGPRARYRTLADLRTGLRLAGAPADAVRHGAWLEAWRLDEAGLGWLAAGDPTAAFWAFDEAIAHVHYVDLARLGRDLALTRLRIPTDPAVMNSRPSSHTLIDAADLERVRAFADALRIYRAVRVETAEQPALLTAMARCHLQLRDGGEAAEHARRALALDPHHAEAMVILVNALLLRRHLPEALLAADALIAQTPEEGAADHARGKCLLALGRFVEARDSFDRAIARSPRIVESMLLRRQADRHLKHHRGATGEQPVVEHELPPHLGDVRAALVTGRVDDAVALLREPHHAIDPAAQLLLGNLLAFSGAAAAAIEIYEQVAYMSEEHRAEAILAKEQVLAELVASGG